MKSRLHYLCKLLCLLGTFSVLHATELPTTVQFDLIFPRNNSVYKPVYPFPVVFGLHNGSAAWPYVLTWNWDVVRIALNSTGSEYEVVASGGWIPGVPGVEKPGPPPDTYLIIDPVDQLVNTTAQQYLLRYNFGITHSCNETTREVPRERELDVTFYESIFFSLDPESGSVPDLTDVGPCATPLGSVGIQKEVQNMDGVCPILAPGPQPTQPCAFPLNGTLATKVAARMLQHAECPEQTIWPNVTGLLGRCKPKTSGQSQLGSDMIVFSTMAVFAGFVILSVL